MGFVGEWGVSILVQDGKNAVLLDTDMTDTVLETLGARFTLSREPVWITERIGRHRHRSR